MKYLGKRESSPTSVEHTQPMETIGGAEFEVIRLGPHSRTLLDSLGQQ